MSKSSDVSLAAELLEVQRTLGWMDLVIGNITDAVYVTDVDSKLVFVNQFFSDLVGMPRVFLLGQKIDEVLPTSLVANPQKEFLPHTHKKKPVPETDSNIYQCKLDDCEYIFKISSRFIKTINQTVFIAKDITHEYEQSQLKTNFINIASHQLRTPMSSIMTYSHMLYEGYGGELVEGQKELTSTIITASERMITLINDILLISRIENGETNLVVKDTTLGEVLDSIDTELITRFKDRQIEYEHKYAPRVKEVRCNRFVIHEIFSNILSNALQYTPEKGTISVSARVEGDQLTVEVSDNGIGIPEQELPKIFDQFSRADNAFEVFNEGTGLGLYVVKILIGHLKGTVSCKSTLNKGTTFTIVFPS